MAERSGHDDADIIGSVQVSAARQRIGDQVRPAVCSFADRTSLGAGDVRFVHEYLQHTGSFKPRGAANLVAYHLEAGSMPDAGVVIASGGNAGLACAWAAAASGTRATVFLPESVPATKLDRIRSYGPRIRLVSGEYADALAASILFAESEGALLSHAYDNPLIVAGAGTIALEILERMPEVETIVVAVGGGGLLAGIVAALEDRPVRVVGVEPERCRALNAALQAGYPIDVSVDSVAADSLGARRVSTMAYELATRPSVTSVLVSDDDISRARRWLWNEHRVVVEHGGAAALAAVQAAAYEPAPGEVVAVVLCGANTDPTDLAATP